MELELTHGKQIASLIGPDLRRLLQETQDPEMARELLEDFHPEELADLIRELDTDESADILRMLPDDMAAPIFERLGEPAQAALVTSLGLEQTADIAAEMSADERTDLIENLPEEVGEQLLETLQRVAPEAAAEARSLARWEEGTAGGLMTTEYLSVGLEATVEDVIALVRKLGEEVETAYYTFVVGKSNRLAGVVSLRTILLASTRDRIADIMTERMISTPPEADQEEVARLMSKYDLIAIPVVDATGTLLGVITSDDIMDVLTQEGTEDVQKLGGMEAIDLPYFSTKFTTFIRARGTWLILLFVSEFFTGTALRHFDNVIKAVETLAFYVPLLISTGGNSGGQSATLIIRGLATAEIKLKDWWRVASRELLMGLVLGSLLAIVGAVRALMWGDGPRFAFVIAFTLLGIVTMGCFVGSMLPFILKRVGLDPATSSAPFIASLVDVLGILIYFNVSKIVLAQVIEHAMKAKAVVGH